MRILLGVALGIAVTHACHKYGARVLWAMFSRGDT